MGSLQVEETSAYCTVNHRASASNYQLSNMKCPARDSNWWPQRMEARSLTATPPSPPNWLSILILKGHSPSTRRTWTSRTASTNVEAVMVVGRQNCIFGLCLKESLISCNLITSSDLLVYIKLTFLFIQALIDQQVCFLLWLTWSFMKDTLNICNYSK